MMIVMAMLSPLHFGTHRVKTNPPKSLKSDFLKKTARAPKFDPPKSFGALPPCSIFGVFAEQKSAQKDPKGL